jgi:Fe2+ or Zn2+ uptake regulation protein
MVGRQTKQKNAISEELVKFSSFFTAEDLFAKVKDRDMGVATVYRFLKNLRDKGKIHSYICNRRTLYSKDKQSHSHFICERCGKVEHFKIENVDFLKDKIKGSICHFQLDVSGVCVECLSKQKTI